MSKKLIYVAHPYGGKKSNREKIDVIMNELIFADTANDYVSPIHICLGLLGHCDILVLCDGWEQSRGCKGEYEYAQKHGKDIFKLDEWKALNRI